MGLPCYPLRPAGRTGLSISVDRDRRKLTSLLLPCLKMLCGAKALPAATGGPHLSRMPLGALHRPL